jgi:hypothetical protein
MCRNIKMLFNFEPPATEDEIRAAALQFVRKIAGTRKPSKANEKAFAVAIEEIYKSSKKMLEGMTPSTPPRDRVTEALKAKERSKLRFRKAG